jgi:hypothetical protein
MNQTRGKKKSAIRTQLARRDGRQPASSAKVPKRLVADLRKLIDESRQALARTVNTALVWLYWNIGKRIREDILKQKRAEYGEQIVQTLSGQLAAEYGRGFSRRNLFNMVRFAEMFPDREIVHALSAQLSWTHFRELLPLDDPLKRDFYAEMCRIERWSVRTLQKKIGGMLFERTALSKKPEKLARQELAALRDEVGWAVPTIHSRFGKQRWAQPTLLC